MDYSDDEEHIPIEPQTPKEPCQISAFNGTKFVEEVLNGPNENCCKHFRMDKQLVYKFCDILQAKGLLRHTNRIKIEEQLAIFLFTVGHNQRTRAVQERFQYSGETISRHFNNVLNAILTLSLDYFLSPGLDTPQEILNDSRFYPYFKDCVGVVDGTHVPVMVGVDEQGPFRNKNGYLSQNVMAACSFDSQFQYVLAGWEGSATDSRILSAALKRRSKLHIPEGKYYLVDTDYPNMPGFLSPYPDAPYYNHLSEFTSVDEYPQNAKELFNYRHSLLRNAINNAFKGLKTRFPILVSAPPYPLQTQVKLVIATCIIHNFIAKEKGHDWLLSICEDGKGQGEIEPPTATTRMETSLEPHFSYNEIELGIASELRDAIAAEMWNDHIQDFSTV